MKPQRPRLPTTASSVIFLEFLMKENNQLQRPLATGREFWLRSFVVKFRQQEMGGSASGDSQEQVQAAAVRTSARSGKAALRPRKKESRKSCPQPRATPRPAPYNRRGRKRVRGRGRPVGNLVCAASVFTSDIRHGSGPART